MTISLQQLKYFIEVARVGSINQAAEILFITQPSLSKAIKDIEAEVDLSLFQRSSKGISLTADGAEFLGYARQVVEQSDLLEYGGWTESPLENFVRFRPSIMLLR